MAWLVTDVSPDVVEGGRVSLDPKQQEQVLNLAQDVCSAVAALHTFKTTRTKQTVSLLNRFGNSIRYQDAQRYKSTMAD